MGASQHNDTISSIQWLADGSQFIASSMDCKLIFYVGLLLGAVLMIVCNRNSPQTMVIQYASNHRFRNHPRYEAYPRQYDITQTRRHREQTETIHVGACGVYRRGRRAGRIRVWEHGAQSGKDQAGRSRDCRVSRDPRLPAICIDRR